MYLKIILTKENFFRQTFEKCTEFDCAKKKLLSHRRFPFEFQF